MSSWRQAGLKYVAANKHLFIRVKVKWATEKRATEKTATENWATGNWITGSAAKNGKVGKKGNKNRVLDISPTGHFPYRTFPLPGCQ